MTVLTFPALVAAPSRYSLGLIANTQSGGRSPFTGSEQTLQLPGARWGGELSWSNLEEAEWRVLQAFLASLGGRAGRFTWAPAAQPRRGNAPLAGPCQVHGGGQLGAVVTTRGWQPQSGISFRTGDLIGWQDPAGRPQMHVVTLDCGPDASGYCGVPIAPPIRRSPANGIGVTFSPAPIFRLSEDSNPLVFAGNTVLSEASIKIEESIFG